MRTKAQSIYSSLLCCDYDIVIMTETWLNADFNSQEYFPSYYSVYRRDRESCNANQVGGGVLIAVKNDLESHQVNIKCK